MAEETELPMEGVARLAVTFTAVVASEEGRGRSRDTTRKKVRRHRHARSHR